MVRMPITRKSRFERVEGFTQFLVRQKYKIMARNSEVKKIPRRTLNPENLYSPDDLY